MEEKKKELEKLGIYQLRIYARQVGVKLATTYKKNELIELILKVMSGEIEPYFKTSKKGRPPKELQSITSTLSVTKEDDFSIGGRYEYGYQGLNSVALNVEYVEDTPTEELEGLLDILDTGAGLLVDFKGSKKHVFISKEMIQQNKLVIGDLVKATAFQTDAESPYFLKDIISINSTALSKYVAPSKKDNTAKRPFKFNTPTTDIEKVFDLTGIKLHYGDRILCAGLDKRIVPIASYNFCGVLDNVSDTEQIIIALNSSKEYMDAYGEFKNSRVIGCNFTDDEEFQMKLCELGIRHVINLSKVPNRNVVCILPDLENVLDCCSNANKERVLNMLKVFFFSAYCTATSSLTVFYGINETNPQLRSFETNETVFLKICDFNYVKQLMFKFNWIVSGRNELSDFNACQENDDYNTAMFSFLKKGNTYDRQALIEGWCCEGNTKEQIIAKMQEY